VNHKYPPSNEIASVSQQRELYDRAVAEINDYKSTARIANAGSKMIAQDKDKYKKEAKIANKQVLTLTKKQQATSAAKKAGAWSGASTIGITILYETWKVVGFPGGNQWMEWWNHEAIYGIMVWVTTCAMGWLYRASHPGR
tara:strand:+ start:689 stop:1111 length:423 start_codon:yes stop_codon:yes gene_type:complete